MILFTKWFKKSYSLLLYLSVLILLPACSSNESTLTTQSENQDGIPVPSIISTALPPDGTLYAYLRIDDGPRRAMTINGDTASITLNGVSLGQHTITMEFEFVLNANLNQPLILASASQTMNVSAGENPPLSFTDYDTDSFDLDGDGISNLAELSNGSNPFAGIVVSPVSGNTSEDGSTATFTVVLSSQPTADVVIGISSSVTTEGTVDIDSLTFNTTNWDTPQIITITGENDSSNDGDQPYTIILAAATSGDPDYNGIDPADVSLSNLEYNFPPSASNVTITDGNSGSTVVGDTLTGSYDFSDADSDVEEGSTFRWLRNGTAIANATSSTYRLTLEDSGQLISFEVTPLAANGTSPGSPETSAEVTVDNAPVASDVKITANAPLITGTVLTGNYTYSDANSDIEGDSIYLWLRDDLPIAGATSSTYTLTDIDIGNRIRFKVVPVALTGSIRGAPALSKAAINVNLIGEAGAGLPRATAIKGNYAYMASSGILTIIDISDPTNPSEVAYYDTPGFARQVTIRDEYAYVVDDNGMIILDISIPTAPTKIAAIETMGGPRNIEVNGNYAYIADRSGALRIIDIFDVFAPTEATVVDTAGYVYDVVTSGIYAYVADNDYGLRIFDITNPYPPNQTTQTEVGSFQITQGFAKSVAVSGDYAYVACGSGGLRIINISNPGVLSEPGFVGIPAPESYFDDVVIDGEYAYVVESGLNSGLRIYNISNPEVPVLEGTYLVPGNFGNENVTINGTHAYMADRDYGLRVVDISDPATPAEISAVKTTGFSYNIAVNGNYAYMAKFWDGLGIFDISDPTVPIEVGAFTTPGAAYGVAVQGDYAYVADRLSGLRIINISDPTSPSHEGAFVTQDIAYYDVAVSGEFAFVAGDTNGLVIINISQANAPFEETAFDTQGGAEAVTINGSHAFVADNLGGLQIVDITDPTAPTSAGFVDIPGASDVAVSGNYAYVVDGTGLLIIDISTLAIIGTLSTPDNAMGVAISGNYAYVADELSGIRIIDVSVPETPVEVGLSSTPGEAFGVAISGNYAYVADNGFGLSVYEFVAP